METVTVTCGHLKNGRRASAAKLRAVENVDGFLDLLAAFQREKKPDAMGLIRELRLVVRQANNGDGCELQDHTDSYLPDLDQADVCLCLCNALERNFGLRISSYESIGRDDWAEMTKEKRI